MQGETAEMAEIAEMAEADTAEIAYRFGHLFIKAQRRLFRIIKLAGPGLDKSCAQPQLSCDKS